MTIESEKLKGEIRETVAGLRTGDIPQRTYDKKIVELSVSLCRSLIKERLTEEERIIEEHHVIRNHLKLNQSVLKETSQEAISLFLTDRRLFSLTSTFDSDDAISRFGGDNTSVVEADFGDIAKIKLKWEIRFGEMVAGVAISVFALLFHKYLMITGILMFGLGVLGFLHGLLLPTKWIEIEMRKDKPDPGIKVFAIGKKSAKKLVGALKKNTGEGFVARSAGTRINDTSNTSTDGENMAGIPVVSYDYRSQGREKG